MPKDVGTIEISSAAQMTERPIVSVYMAVYNHAPFLASAIEGVLMQRTGVPFELIIGEDCSTDDSQEIARDFQKKNPHIIRIMTSARNVGSAANATRCLARVRGTYLAYCEGDDYWTDPDKLDTQLAVFSKYPDCSLVFHSARVEDAMSGDMLFLKRASFRSRFITPAEVMLGDGGLMATASIMIKSRLPRQRPHWWRDAPIEDYPLAIKAAVSGRIAYLDRCMSVYRAQVPGSWSSRHSPRWDTRLHYARAMQTMFDGFNLETDCRYKRYSDLMVSKYFSDVLVSIPGSTADKRSIFSEIKEQLSRSDRFLAGVTVNTGLSTAWFKSIWRKIHTFFRVLHGELSQPGVK